MSPGGKRIKFFLSGEEVASATMDSLLLQLQDRFTGLKSIVKLNTSQEFELFTSKSWQGSDSVIQAHSTDQWFS